MDPLATIRRRHASQRLSGKPFASVTEAVRWSGAVQAQEFAEVKWSLAERLAGAPTDAEVEPPFTDGEILRTHVMRPTWHFVAAEDLRWLLRLTAPRVLATTRGSFATLELELDGAALARAHRTIAGKLAGGEPQTRKELVEELRRDGFEGDSVRFGFMLLHAELESLICSGPRRGKQHTYMLFDERVPANEGPSGDAALAELARRYFRSHGPATVRDLSWWSGLTMAQSRQAIALAGVDEEPGPDGTAWYSFGSAEAPVRNRALLLPTYDELIVAYKDLRVDHVPAPRRGWQLTPTIAIDGRTVGGWKRTLAKDSVTVEVTAFAPLDRDQRTALEQAVERFGAFLELEAGLELSLA